MKFTGIILIALTAFAAGHIEMRQPYPLRSSLNPMKQGSIDYNMKAPLAADGSNYPCKGYHKDIAEVTPVAQYAVGSTQSIILDGSADHGGGSCQLSLSYDKGVTFKVIHSIIGGCPKAGMASKSYDFRIPVNALAANKVLFAWTWFNKIGNREMYMNCAVVDILPSTAPQNVGGLYSGIFDGSSLFKANIYGGTCQISEGVEVVFPNPGQSVEYGGPYANWRPVGPTILKGCPAGENFPGPLPELPQKSLSSTAYSSSTSVNSVTSKNISSSDTVSVVTLTRSNSSWTSIISIATTNAMSTTTRTISTLPNSPPMVTDAGNGGIKIITVTHTVYTTVYGNISDPTTESPSITSSTSCSTTTTQSVLPIAYGIQKATNAIYQDIPQNRAFCEKGKILCNGPLHITLCIDNNLANAVSLGRVPVDTVCIEGSTVRVRDGSRAGNCEKAHINTIHCLGESNWARCDGYHWIHMGRVPDGMKCSKGDFVRV